MLGTVFIKFVPHCIFTVKLLKWVILFKLPSKTLNINLITDITYYITQKRKLTIMIGIMYDIKSAL